MNINIHSYDNLRWEGTESFDSPDYTLPQPDNNQRSNNPNNPNDPGGDQLSSSGGTGGVTDSADPLDYLLDSINQVEDNVRSVHMYMYIYIYTSWILLK